MLLQKAYQSFKLKRTFHVPWHEGTPPPIPRLQARIDETDYPVLGLSADGLMAQGQLKKRGLFEFSLRFKDKTVQARGFLINSDSIRNLYRIGFYGLLPDDQKELIEFLALVEAGGLVDLG